jgi:hypothetical protein
VLSSTWDFNLNAERLGDPLERLERHALASIFKPEQVYTI